MGGRILHIYIYVQEQGDGFLKDFMRVEIGIYQDQWQDLLLLSSPLEGNLEYGSTCGRHKMECSSAVKFHVICCCIFCLGWRLCLEQDVQLGTFFCAPLLLR